MAEARDWAVGMMLRRLTIGAACTAMVAACGSGPALPTGRSLPLVTVASSNALANCDVVGGCDVDVIHTDGSETIIPLRAHFDFAVAAAMKEVERNDVAGACVIGDAIPHAVMSERFPHK
jgi:hypothetical protein